MTRTEDMVRRPRLAAGIFAVALLAGCRVDGTRTGLEISGSVIRTVAGTGPLSTGGDGQLTASLGAVGPPILHQRKLYLSSSGTNDNELHVIDLDRGVVLKPRFDRLDARWRPLDLRRDTLYMADDYRVYAVDLNSGGVREVAGTGNPDTGGGDGRALSARVAHVNDLAATDDALYLVDESRALRKVDLGTGRISTLVRPEGDLNFSSLAVGDGVVYIRQERGIIAFNLVTGQMSPVAGNSLQDSEGVVVEDGPARQLTLSPLSLALAGRTLYMTDVTESRPQRRVRLRALDLDTGFMRTLAGRTGQGEGDPAPLPDSRPVPLADVRVPEGPLRWNGGLLYASGYQVLAYDLNAGTVATVTAPRDPSSAGDGGPAVLARISTPVSTATDGTRLWITDGFPGPGHPGASIREVDLDTGMIRTLTSAVGGRSLTYADHVLYVAGPGRVHAVDITTGQARTVAGRGAEPDLKREVDPAGNGDGALATDASITPTSTAVIDQKLYIGAQTVRVVDMVTGVISTAPGLGVATDCFLSRAKSPGYFVVTAGAGSLFAADSCGHQIRAVDLASGKVRPVAGTGERPVSGKPQGDGGQAVDAHLNNPNGLALDGTRLLIADTEGHRIRAVDLLTGLIETLAGTGRPGFGGELDAPAAALLARPQGVSVGPDRRIWIADSGNNRVRVVEPREPASSLPAGPRRRP